MALPTNRIKKIKLPGDNNGDKTYDIIPTMLQDGTTTNKLSVPSLSSDDTIVTTNTAQTISGNKTFTGTIYTSYSSGMNHGYIYSSNNVMHVHTTTGEITIDACTDVNIHSDTTGNVNIQNGRIIVPASSTTGITQITFKDFNRETISSNTIYNPTYTFPKLLDNDNHIIATTGDIPTNIQNGSTTGSLQQVFDGSTFTFVNPNSPLNNTTVNIGIATGTYATMLGGKGRVEGKRGFVNGTQVVATGAYSHAEGNNTHANAANSHAEGIQTYANGSASHAEGSSTAATETGAHSEGYGTHADGVYTHSEGSTNFVLGDNAHAEGGSNIVGVYSGPSPEPGPAPEPGTAVHAEGMGSHAEGNNNTITGAYSHAEGQGNTITSNRAHAEGNGNTVSGLYAHAEGNGGVASGEGAHSEGLYGHAIGNYSHAEGAATYANGMYSHAAGQDSAANGTASFASGYHLAANRDYQTVLGKYNLGQADTLLEVGKGTAENARSNAFEVYADGHATVGLMGSTNLSVATKQYVDNNNTKNTAGSTNNNSKLFLVGALAQSVYATTYSRSNTFINANGVLVNTTGFSSYASAISSGSGLLNIGTNAVNYYSGSGPASFKATSSTHGSWQISDNTGNTYLQKTSGSASSGNAYLLFPNVGTSSTPKTLATTDLISSAEFVEVLPSTVTITFTESSSALRTGLSIYDGSDDTGTLLYSIASGGSVTTPQTLTIASGNIFISTTGSRYTYISQGSTGGISNVVITNNGGRGVPVTLSADVSDNGTFTISLDYDY